MGRDASKLYSRLSESIAEKRKERYSVITNWISRKISFALVNCVCMCVRGSRSIYSLTDIDLEIDPVPVKYKYICHEHENYAYYVNCNFIMSKCVYKYRNYVIKTSLVPK